MPPDAAVAFQILIVRFICAPADGVGRGGVADLIHLQPLAIIVESMEGDSSGVPSFAQQVGTERVLANLNTM